ncbi:Small GTPase superfamily, ARF/SAR type [Corchorus olitorius]|uniref:Small GTPase superfamily, ARF/SAR type n=1 Tax=Corchorus olitorius TaxID=93759 RepID=A0A1R3GZ55_9ROSI|nr:Small GTPase superfamily, ARF/SAR type [Corchorus olitorius]
MGSTISRIARNFGFLPRCRLRILMVGLDASGKTTILYKLKLGDLLKTKPTVAEIEKESQKPETRCIQCYLMLNELANTPVLVFANKQDLSNAMTPTEIADKLGLHCLGQRPWYIQGTSAHSGFGLYEGLDWLSNNIPCKAEEFSYCSIPHLFSHRNDQNEFDLKLIELEKEVVIT